MSYSKQKQPYKGLVKGVVSGNSLIINFIDKNIEPYMIINVDNLNAPRLGTNDGKIQDEPFAFDSWNYLRKLCIGKKVLVGPIIKKIHGRNPNEDKMVPCAYGFLKVAHSHIKVQVDNTENFADVGEIICQAGYARVRDISPDFEPKTNSYLAKLQEYQAEAEANKRGIWSEEEGLVRNLPVPYNDNQILKEREYTAIVENVVNGTSLQLFLMPNHEFVIFQIAGCRADLVNKRNPDKESPGFKAYQDILKKFLHKTIQVRLCQKVSNPQDNENDLPHRYTGCVIGEPDKAFQKLIFDGFARYDPKTSDYAPNADEYIVKELVARAKKLGTWKNIKEEEINVNRLPTDFPTEFQGTVTRIHSSCSFEIVTKSDKGDQKYIVYLNNVKAPYFFFYKSGGCEPFGYEAREFLRKHYVGQVVKVVVDGCYNTNSNPAVLYGIRVFATIYHEKKCINEEFVRSGFAQYHDSFIDRSSQRAQQIRQADQEARDKKNGMHNTNLQVEAAQVEDLVNYTNLQRRAQEVLGQIREQKLEGVIEHITMGGRLYVYIPSKGIYIKCGVNGIISYSAADRMSSDVYKYMTAHFEQATVEIVPCILGKYECFYCWITIKSFFGKSYDLAEELLKNGLAEINKQFLKNLPSNYISLQNNAENQEVGVWSIKTRHNYKLRKGAIEKVKLASIWNPIKLTIQLLEKEMDNIKAYFEKNGASLKPIPMNDLNNEDLCVNDCIVVKLNGMFYRARIDAFEPQKHGIKDIFLIDFCEPKKDIFNNLKYEFFYLPDDLKSIESQACVVNLAFLQNALKSEDEINKAVDELFQMCTDFVLYAHLVYEDESGINILLTDQESRDSGTLNSVVLQRQFARFVDHEAPSEFENAKNQLAKYQPPPTEEQNINDDDNDNEAPPPAANDESNQKN